MECGLFMGRENEGWRPDTLVGPVFMGKELRRIVTRYKLCWLYSGVTVLVRCRKRLDKPGGIPLILPLSFSGFLLFQFIGRKFNQPRVSRRYVIRE